MKLSERRRVNRLNKAIPLRMEVADGQMLSQERSGNSELRQTGAEKNAKRRILPV